MSLNGRVDYHRKLISIRSKNWNVRKRILQNKRTKRLFCLWGLKVHQAMICAAFYVQVSIGLGDNDIMSLAIRTLQASIRCLPWRQFIGICSCSGRNLEDFECSVIAKHE